MPRPLVFISHSTKAATGLPAEALREIKEKLEALQQAGTLAYFLDRTSTQGGLKWRPQIYTPLWRARAAVLLVSEAALQSPHVIAEVNVLTTRFEVKDDPLSRLFVVALAPVTVDDIKGHAQFAAVDVPDVHIFSARDAEEAAQHIAAMAGQLSDALGKPDVPAALGDQVSRVLNHLRTHISVPTTLEDLEDELLSGVAAPAAPANERGWRLAYRLLQGDFEDVLAALVKIKTRTGSPQLLEALVGEIKSTWIDPDAAELVRRALEGSVEGSAALLRSVDDYAVDMLLHRGYCGMPPPTIELPSKDHAEAGLAEAVLRHYDQRRPSVSERTREFDADRCRRQLQKSRERGTGWVLRAAPRCAAGVDDVRTLLQELPMLGLLVRDPDADDDDERLSCDLQSRPCCVLVNVGEDPARVGDVIDTIEAWKTAHLQAD